MYISPLAILIRLSFFGQVTEPLRKKIQPLNSATKQILKERDARASILKRKPGQGLDEEKKKRDEEKAMVEGLVKEGGLTNGEGSGMYELTGRSSLFSSPKPKPN